jgi:LacI family transcriptional regulator
LPPTLRDVARKAGVSIKTVSRVVNGQGEISDSTRRRVQETIAELDYRPSKLARALVTRRTETVGLVLSDITNPFFLEVARGVIDTAEAQGYNVFVCNTDSDPSREIRILRSLTDHAVDGIIIFPTFELKCALPEFARLSHPIVTVNRPADCPGVSNVMLHSRRGAKLAVEHLIRQGHRAIGMVAGQSPTVYDLLRVQGYCAALVEHGLPVIEDWIVPGPPVEKQGREAARALLLQHPEITALFAYNDLLALGALKAGQDLGRRVPQELAVVGFDDILLADRVSPALTTVRVDKYDLGCRAMQRLIQMLNQPGEPFPPLWLDAELVVRASA